MKSSDIARLLPLLFQRVSYVASNSPGPIASPLDVILGVMESLHNEPERVLSSWDFLNPYETSDEIVVYLASWLDVLGTADPELGPTASPTAATRLSSGIVRLRELVARGAYLSQYRGTYEGLTEFLRTATGVSDLVVEQGPGESPYHMVIRASHLSKPLEPLLRRIIEAEKPAHLTYRINFDQPE